MNTGKDVIIYMNLKHSSDYIDSKYIQVHGLTPKVQVFLLIPHSWHFQHTQETKEFSQVTT